MYMLELNLRTSAVFIFMKSLQGGNINQETYLKDTTYRGSD